MNGRILAHKLAKAVLYACIFFVIPLYVTILVGPSAAEWLQPRAVGAFPLRPVEISKTASVNGIAVGDYDQDGDDDIFLAAIDDASSTPSILLENRDGILVDVTKQSGLPVLYGTSAFFANIDTTPSPELIVQTLDWTGRPQVPHVSIRAFRYLASSRRFVDSTRQSGLDVRIRGDEATGAFADLDNDSDLDFIRSINGEVRHYSFAAQTRHPFWRGFFYGARLNRRVCRESADLFFMQEPRLAEALEKDFGSRYAVFDMGGCLFYGPSNHGSPGVSFSLIAPWDTSFLSLKAYIPGSISTFENRGGHFVSHGDLPFVFNHLPEDTLAARGQRSFSELSGSFFQIVATDINGDDKPDIIASGDGGRNLSLVNRGNFSFIDEGITRGLDIKGSGMGIALSDTSRTGTLDTYITNFGHAFHFKMHTDGFVIDQNMSINHLGNGWGIAAFDFDNDGWSDLYVSNGIRFFSQEHGSLRESNEIETSRWGYSYMQDRLYRNQAGSFISVDSTLGFMGSSSRPVAVLDVNGDGYDDLLLGIVGNAQKGAYLLKNMGGSNRFTQIRLVGTRSNKDGIGATIIVANPDGGSEKKLVAIGESFSAQHSLTKTFGLGAYAGEAVEARIHWPSGHDQTATLVVGKLNIITESGQ